MTRRLAIVTHPTATHLVPTRGERRLCAHEAACLDGHIAAHPHGDVPASCPPGCRWWEEPRTDVTEHIYVGGAGALAHIEQPRRGGAHDGGGALVGQRPRMARKPVMGGRRER